MDLFPLILGEKLPIACLIVWKNMGRGEANLVRSCEKYKEKFIGQKLCLDCQI